MEIKCKLVYNINKIWKKKAGHSHTRPEPLVVNIIA